MILKEEREKSDRLSAKTEENPLWAKRNELRKKLKDEPEGITAHPQPFPPSLGEVFEETTREQIERALQAVEEEIRKTLNKYVETFEALSGKPLPEQKTKEEIAPQNREELVKSSASLTEQLNALLDEETGKVKRENTALFKALLERKKQVLTKIYTLMTPEELIQEIEKLTKQIEKMNEEDKMEGTIAKRYVRFLLYTAKKMLEGREGNTTEKKEQIPKNPTQEQIDLLEKETEAIEEARYESKHAGDGMRSILANADATNKLREIRRELLGTLSPEELAIMQKQTEASLAELMLTAHTDEMEDDLFEARWTIDKISSILANETPQASA